MKTIECPRCGHVEEYEDGTTVLLCDVCDEMIFVPDEDV